MCAPWGCRSRCSICICGRLASSYSPPQMPPGCTRTNPALARGTLSQLVGIRHANRVIKSPGFIRTPPHRKTLVSMADRILSGTSCGKEPSLYLLRSGVLLCPCASHLATAAQLRAMAARRHFGDRLVTVGKCLVLWGFGCSIFGESQCTSAKIPLIPGVKVWLPPRILRSEFASASSSWIFLPANCGRTAPDRRLPRSPFRSSGCSLNVAASL